MPENLSNINLPAVLTVSEVAHKLRVSKMTIYRLIDSGELPAIRVGRSFRIPAPAVEELLRTGYRQPGTLPASSSVTP